MSRELLHSNAASRIESALTSVSLRTNNFLPFKGGDWTNFDVGQLGGQIEPIIANEDASSVTPLAQHRT